MPLTVPAARLSAGQQQCQTATVFVGRYFAGERAASLLHLLRRAKGEFSCQLFAVMPLPVGQPVSAGKTELTGAGTADQTARRSATVASGLGLPLCSEGVLSGGGPEGKLPGDCHGRP